MQVPIAEARMLAADVLAAHGMPRDHAETVADHLVDAAGAGHAFAGLPRVMALVGNMKECPPGAPITIEERTPNLVMIDGGGNNGYVTSLLAIDKAIGITRDRGFAIAGVRNTWFSGRLAYYVERAAKAGFIALHTASTQALVAPAGGIDRILGTNPIAFAFPCDPDPVVVDFGTSMTTWGDVLLRQKLGKALQPGVAVDQQGRQTTDPTQALLGAFLPWGGHRGYGIALVAQILGILCGGTAIVENVADCGFFFLVFDPQLLMPLDAFKARLGELVSRIETSRPARGVDRVRIPGKGSTARRAATRASGMIDVDPVVLETLQALRHGPAR
jgi:LDH2 family malate/lactate/ureidoglycolate dehydrogenase